MNVKVETAQVAGRCDWPGGAGGAGGGDDVAGAGDLRNWGADGLAGGVAHAVGVPGGAGDLGADRGWSYA